jgi:hypothetical protein
MGGEQASDCLSTSLTRWIEAKTSSGWPGRKTLRSIRVPHTPGLHVGILPPTAAHCGWRFILFPALGYQRSAPQFRPQISRMVRPIPLDKSICQGKSICQVFRPLTPLFSAPLLSKTLPQLSAFEVPVITTIFPLKFLSPRPPKMDECTQLHHAATPWKCSMIVPTYHSSPF